MRSPSPSVTNFGWCSNPDRPVNRSSGVRKASMPRNLAIALAFVPLPDQLLDCAGEGRLEVDQFCPRRRHDDPDHAVIQRTDLGLPLDALLGRHLVAAVHLQVLV